MSRWTIVARHEWRSVWRDRAVPAALVVFVALMTAATFTSVERTRLRLSDERAISQEVTEGIESRRRAVEIADKTGAQPYGDIRRLNGVRQRPVLATGPQAFLAAGTAETQPQRASFLPLVGRWNIFDEARADFENPDVTAVGRLDPAAVIVFLLPLLLLALTCDVWVMEREMGTVALLYSQPVHRRDLWIGKALVHAVLPVCLCAVIVGGAAAFGTRLLTGGWTGAGTGALAAAALTAAYAAVWTALGLWLSARASSSERAIAAGGMAWVVGVLVLPAVSAITLDQLAPAPSFGERANAVRLATAEANAEGGTIRESRTGQLPAAATIEERAARLWEGTRGRLDEIAKGEQAAGPVAGAYDEAMARRVALERWGRWISPATLALDGYERLAGTDAERALSFQRAALELHGAMRTLVHEYAATDHYMVLADFDRVPQWSSPRVQRRSTVVISGALAAAAAALLWAAYLRSRN